MDSEFTVTCLMTLSPRKIFLSARRERRDPLHDRDLCVGETSAVGVDASYIPLVCGCCAPPRAGGAGPIAPALTYSVLHRNVATLLVFQDSVG